MILMAYKSQKYNSFTGIDIFFDFDTIEELIN